MQLTWWEFEQLIEHFNHRRDIWSSPKENMWLRTFSEQDDTAMVGLVVTPPKQNGPFRQYDVRTISMGWDDAQCKEYLTALAMKWTDYGTRRRYAEFLITEANIPVDRAQLIAFGLCAVEQNGSPDPDITPLPTNRELWPDIEGPDINTSYLERTLRTFGLVGGGWLSIRLQGGQLRVRAALRGDGRYGAGYSGRFEGFIHPTDGNAKIAAAFLFASQSPEDRAQGLVRVVDSGPPQFLPSMGVGTYTNIQTASKLEPFSADEMVEKESGDDNRSE